MVRSVCHPPFAKSREGWGTHCVVCHRKAGPPAAGTTTLVTIRRSPRNIVCFSDVVISSYAASYAALSALTTRQRVLCRSELPFLITLDSHLRCYARMIRWPQSIGSARAGVSAEQPDVLSFNVAERQNQIDSLIKL